MHNQSLSETIFNLQRRPGLRLEPRHLVEEAAQLLDRGREIEASALVEKAQALVERDAPLAVVERPTASGIEQIGSRFASELAGVLNRMLQEVAQVSHDEVSALRREVEQQFRAADDHAQQIALMREKLDQLAADLGARLAAVDQRHSAFGDSLARLEHADQARQAEIARAAAEMHEARRELSAEVAALVKRLDLQQSGIDAALASIHERLQSHTGEIEKMNQQQARRSAVLVEALAAIARLSADPSPDAASQPA